MVCWWKIICKRGRGLVAMRLKQVVKVWRETTLKWTVLDFFDELVYAMVGKSGRLQWQPDGTLAFRSESTHFVFSRYHFIQISKKKTQISVSHEHYTKKEYYDEIRCSAEISPADRIKFEEFRVSFKLFEQMSRISPNYLKAFKRLADLDRRKLI